MYDIGRDINLQRFAEMWRQSRMDAGLSQDYVANKLKVSKKTIQNWEQGVSAPSQVHAFEWFKAIDRQPLPYYLSLVYPEEFKSLSPCSSDDDIDTALFTIIKNIPTYAKRELLYCAYGNHGSSPICILEMITAYLHTPLRQRLNIAQAIVTNYEMCVANGDIINANHILPHVDVFKKAISLGRKSIMRGKKTYTIMEVAVK